MTKKGEVFRWTNECQEAFEKLKVALTTTPVLAMPEEEGRFTLDTDASNCAVGAVLSQMHGGQEKVVAYASRKLSKAESNYCTTRKELFAVVNFVKYYKHFLQGRSFTIRTDYAALQWLRRIPEPVRQQARCIGFLEEFDFDIAHRPAFRHANADALSRRPCQSSSGCCTAAVRLADEEQSRFSHGRRSYVDAAHPTPFQPSVARKKKVDQEPDRSVGQGTQLRDYVDLGEQDVVADELATQEATQATDQMPTV